MDMNKNYKSPDTERVNNLKIKISSVATVSQHSPHHIKKEVDSNGDNFDSGFDKSVIDLDKDIDMELQMPQLTPIDVSEIKVEEVVIKDEPMEIESEKLPELFPLPQTSTDENNAQTQQLLSRSSSSSSTFIDSLLEKLRRPNSDTSETETSPPKASRKNSLSEEDLLVEMNKPIRCSKSNNPNLLPTPIVENQRALSIFVNSDEDGKSIVRNKRSRESMEQDDKSKMTSKTQLPTMKLPTLPSNIKKPRTLAEKRMLVKNNVEFLMMEQESKIYKQIQRKKQGEELGYHLIESLIVNDVPIKNDPWKALKWLRTLEGNYFHLHINIDGKSYKLIGSHGNHIKKYLPDQSSLPFPKKQFTFLRSTRCCEGGKVKKRTLECLMNSPGIQSFIFDDGSDSYKKLEVKDLNNQLSQIMPRPLSKKVEYINLNRKTLDPDEDNVFLGDYTTFDMPNIKLEVGVQPKVPLDPKAKQYLTEMIPYKDMDENWVNFSLSSLSSKSEEETSENKFEFDVPYQGNRKTILVREVVRSKEDTESLRIFDSSDNDIDEMVWTFAEKANKKDKLEMEIVDIIKDLTNSTFVNLNDDLFTKEDPHKRDDKSSDDSPLKELQALEELARAPTPPPPPPPETKKKPQHSRKLLLELRRLNANVVKTSTAQFGDEETFRRRATAHLGREERKLRPTVIVTESDTVLIGNTDKEARRTKRAPKRFNDYLNPNKSMSEQEEFEVEPYKKTKTSKESHDVPYKSRNQQTNESFTTEELKTMKNEIKKWFHCNVELRRINNLDTIQVYCMIHNLYKCPCKRVTTYFTESKADVERRLFAPTSVDDKSEADEEEETTEERENEQETLLVRRRSEDIDMSTDLMSQRVLPVSRNTDEDKVSRAIPDLSDDGTPKMEILNLSDLINGKIGPIFINIYDTKLNRLNTVFRSILNNKSALAYVDGLAYFIDTQRVDVTKIKFNGLRGHLDHPVFIIQPKNNFPSPISSTMSDDFVKLLFKDESKVLLQVRDKARLREISEIIETVLFNVRKKLTVFIEGEPNHHLREQLSMISRKRLNSVSSDISSADTSPLHFDEKGLERAPEPGFDTPEMENFNKIFSARMKRLCAMIKSNTLELRTSENYVDKFYIYQWSLLLKAYEENLVEIWQVTMVGQSGDKYLMLAITDSSTPPQIEKVKPKHIVNLKKMSLSDNMTELTRLIILRVESEKTKFMTLLLYGCKGYFRICGMLRNNEDITDGFVATPNRLTHPRLTAKIQKMYNLWHEVTRLRETHRNESSIEDLCEEQDFKIPEPERSQRFVTANIVKKLREMDNQPSTSSGPKPPPKVWKEVNKPNFSTESQKQVVHKTFSVVRSMEQPRNNLDRTGAVSNVIKIDPQKYPVVKTTQNTSMQSTSSESKENMPVKDVQIPPSVRQAKSVKSKFKWFLFNVSNDFSDILIKHYKKYLPYKTVVEGIQKAKAMQKTVALVPRGDYTWPQIYALPTAPLKFQDQASMTNSYILFGPYTINANSNLLLMQNVDGAMYLRDDYEKMKNIKRTVKTRCLWLYANTLKCIADVHKETVTLTSGGSFSKTETGLPIHSNRKKNHLKIVSIIGGFQDDIAKSE